MYTAGIREFKAKISQYLADVRRGEVILITDRGEVVAEVRSPLGPAGQDPRTRALGGLVLRGELRLGDPRLPGATLREGIGSGLSSADINRALSDSRRESRPRVKPRRRR